MISKQYGYRFINTGIELCEKEFPSTHTNFYHNDDIFVHPLELCYLIFRAPLKEVNAKLFNFVGRGNVCQLCGKVYTEPCSIDCGHVFCGECICNYNKNNNQCPVCNKPIKKMTKLYGFSELKGVQTTPDHTKVLLMRQKQSECLKELKEVEAILDQYTKALEKTQLKYEEVIQEIQKLDMHHEHQRQQAHAAYSELEVVEAEIQQIEANLRLMEHVNV